MKAIEDFFTIVIIGFAVLLIIAFPFVSCTPYPPDGTPLVTSEDHNQGTWFEVRPPPRAPPGTKCWVFVMHLKSNTAWGGPECFVEGE